MDDRDLYVYLIPTLQCNLRHTFCYQRSFSRDRLPDEVLYERLLSLYRRIKTLRIHGGELTITPGMKEFLQFLHQRFPAMQVNMVTNGVELDASWIEVVRQCDILVSLSLNAVDAAGTQKILKGNKTAPIWDKIHANFHALVDAHWAHPTPLINCISMVVTCTTAPWLLPFAAWGLRHGLNMLFQFPNSSGSVAPELRETADIAQALKRLYADLIDMRLINVGQELAESAQQRQQIHDRCLRELAALGMGTDWMPRPARTRDIALYEQVMDGEPTRRCGMPWRGLAILESGKVLPCSNLWNYELGNIYDEDLEAILNGPARRELQDLVAAGDYRYCYRGCNNNLQPETSVEGLTRCYTPAWQAAFDRGDYAAVVENLTRIPRALAPRQTYSLAFSLHLLGRHAEALPQYDRALQQGFAEFWVRYNRGCLRRLLGHWSEAAVDLQRAVELNPAHAGAAQVLADVQQRLAPPAVEPAVAEA